MSVVIRLKSVGTKKKIKHRIVVTDTRFPRDGRFLEEVGFWDPSTKPTTVKIKADRVEQWVKQGATPSETVKSIFQKAGVMYSNKVKAQTQGTPGAKKEKVAKAPKAPKAAKAPKASK